MTTRPSQKQSLQPKSSSKSFRSSPDSDQTTDIAACLKRARNGLALYSLRATTCDTMCLAKVIALAQVWAGCSALSSRLASSLTADSSGISSVAGIGRCSDCEYDRDIDLRNVVSDHDNFQVRQLRVEFPRPLIQYGKAFGRCIWPPHRRAASGPEQIGRAQP